MSTSSKSPGQIESLFVIFLFVAVVVSDVSVPLDEPPRDEPRAFAGGNGEVGIGKDMSTFIGCVSRWKSKSSGVVTLIWTWK